MAQVTLIRVKELFQIIPQYLIEPPDQETQV